MKKVLAFLMTLAILTASLAAPLSAAPSSKADEKSSSTASSKTDESSSASSSKKDGKEDSKSSSSATSSGGAADDAASGASSFSPPNEEKIMSQSVYMINLDSGAVVYEKEPHKQMMPASLTKIMTCILALENVSDLKGEKTDLKAYIQNELYNLGIDTLGGIYLGESLSIHDLLYAMMLQSANEASMMVADYVGDGSIPYFCELMNKKAKEIGAKNTNFGNASGLFEAESYTTAYDMALIAKYAMEKPEFVEIVTTKSYTSQPTERHADGITWYSINDMQKSSSEYYYEGLKGIKTGTLPEQNIRNYVSVATRDGYSYLLVCLGAPIANSDGAKYQKNLAWVDTALLYDWAFSTFRVKTLMSVGQEVSQVNVRLSWDKDHVKLLAADKFASLVPNEVTDDSVTPEFVIENGVELPVKGQKNKTEIYINAPIKKGDDVGYVKLMLYGEEVGRVRLVAAETIERSSWLYYVDKAKSFLNTFLFKFVLTFVVVVVVLYAILMIIRNRNMRRYQMRRKRPPQQRKL